MDPEEFPVGFDPEAEEPREDVPEGFPVIEPGPDSAGADDYNNDQPKLSSISEAELHERLAEMQTSCGVGGCSGPQCASSVLATRYAKILRQERLLAMAASALHDLEAYSKATINSTSLNSEAMRERSAAIRREIDKERKEKA